MAIGTAILAGLAVLGALAVFLLRPSAPDPRPVEFLVDAPPGTTLANVHSGSAVSPDGSAIVFSAGAPGAVPSLWLRQLRTIGARQLTGTEGATAPGVVAGRQIDRFHGRPQVEAAGSRRKPAGNLADVPRADPNQPVAWSSKGVILFGCPCSCIRSRPPEGRSRRSARRRVRSPTRRPSSCPTAIASSISSPARTLRSRACMSALSRPRRSGPGSCARMARPSTSRATKRSSRLP